MLIRYVTFIKILLVLGDDIFIGENGAKTCLGVIFLVKSKTCLGVVLKMLGCACVQYHT